MYILFVRQLQHRRSLLKSDHAITWLLLIMTSFIKICLSVCRKYSMLETICWSLVDRKIQKNKRKPDMFTLIWCGRALNLGRLHAVNDCVCSNPNSLGVFIKTCQERIGLQQDEIEGRLISRLVVLLTLLLIFNYDDFNKLTSYQQQTCSIF